MAEAYKEHMTAGKIDVEHVAFHSWQTAVGKSEWRSADGRIVVQRNYARKTFRALVDGTLVPSMNPKRARRFLHYDDAMRVAVLTMRDEDAVKAGTKAPRKGRIRCDR